MNLIRRILMVLLGFIAITASLGGIALLFGLEADRFPIAWLTGTPFTGYTIPALLLLYVVGGSAFCAWIMLLRKHPQAKYVALIAGVIMFGYIVEEVRMLKQIPPGPTPIELFYAFIGLTIIVLALVLKSKKCT